MNRLLSYIVIALSVILVSCNKEESSRDGNAAYYWRTSFCLDTTERRFITDNDISRLYVRFFDVVPDVNGNVVPSATITFPDSCSSVSSQSGSLIAGVEIVPVVFILNDCLLDMGGKGTPGNGNGNRKKVEELAFNIMKRVTQMCKTNNTGPLKEMQIDCDWTARTRHTYYSLLSSLHHMCEKNGIRLSATIRLHQLYQEAPPVDCGTLMVYNTGNARDPSCRNPILQMSDVAPYLRHLRDYPLPLTSAYPIFRWTIVWRNSHFVGFMHGGDIETFPGDSIVNIQCSKAEIVRVRDAISRFRPDANKGITLYSVDSANIKHYSHHDIQEIYRR